MAAVTSIIFFSRYQVNGAERSPAGRSATPLATLRSLLHNVKGRPIKCVNDHVDAVLVR